MVMKFLGNTELEEIANSDDYGIIKIGYKEIRNMCRK